MRRRILALVALATLLVPVAPVAAATTGGNTSFHYSQTDKGADATWSTAPADGQLVAGVVYTDTNISTSEQAIRDDGTVFADKFVFFWQVSYKIDRNGNWMTVSESSGFAGGSDVNLSVNAKLTSASVSAAVDLTTCTVDRRGNSNCVDAGIGSVSATWTGQGDAIKQSGLFHVVSKGITSNSTYHQTYRSAISSGQFNGVAIGGQTFYGSIFNSTIRDIFMCHGPGTC